MLRLHRTDTIEAQNFIAPACVIDCSAQSALNPDFILTVEVIEAWEAVQSNREEVDESVSGGSCNFAVAYRGGASSFRSKHVPFDCAATTPRGALPTAFLAEDKMQRMHSFRTLKYGADVACMMAHEVARTHEHFYSIYLESSDEYHIFAEGEAGSYVAWPEWDRFVGLLPVGGPTWQRAQACMAVLPRPRATAR